MKVDHITDTEDHITSAAIAESTASLIEAGSVVVVVRSGILRHSLPVAVTQVDASLNQDMKGLLPSPSFVPDYVAYALRAHAEDILNTCTKSGTTVQSIEFPALLQFQIPLAPLAEQRRIVAAIEEQLTRLDAAVAGLERARAGLRRYRAAVLAAACAGRLVPTEAELARHEGRDYEPASVLLQRILAERRARWEADQLARLHAQGKPPKGDAWKSKYEEPPTPDTNGTTGIPLGWVWTTLVSIATLKGGITKGQKRGPDDVLREVPYLRVANVQRGFLDLSDVKTIHASEREIEELTLHPGDVLFNEGGDRDKLGRGWVWDGQIGECIHQNHVFRARPILSDVSSKFTSWYGNTFGQQYFVQQGKQTTNLASINLTKLSALPIPLPPLAEQHRIVAEVERRLSVVEELERAVEHALARAARLRQSVLRRAFAGKLVPQDPADEPASVLLERIRAERTAAGAKKPRRTRTAARGQLALPEAAGEGQ